MKSPKFFLIFLIFLTGFSFWQGIFVPRISFSTQKNIFSVEKGQSLFQIAKNLEEEGLIKNRFFFDAYVSLKGAQRGLKAGKYEINPSESCAKIAEKIISGDTAKMIVTIPEGFRVKQIEERLNLKLPGENLEGFLFPDTYQFPIGVNGEEVVAKMKENFDKKLVADLREEIEKQGKTIFEIVTMASLIEKEVIGKEDKEIVSGILWKRLKIGMPLQVDATIAYITGKKTTEISREETKIDSPYNTYRYLGLPPGPICNPGLESIITAVYPKISDNWYYLSSSEGETYFSKNLEEHNIKKVKYLE